MGVLLPKIKPLIYSNGGPVITVQVRINNWMHYDLKVTKLPKAAYTTTILPCVAGALEEMWTQKRTERTRGHATETRAWKQYVSVACPVFSRTHISFKRLLRKLLYCQSGHQLLHCVSFRDCFVIAFRGKN